MVIKIYSAFFFSQIFGRYPAAKLFETTTFEATCIINDFDCLDIGTGNHKPTYFGMVNINILMVISNLTTSVYSSFLILDSISYFVDELTFVHGKYFMVKTFPTFVVPSLFQMPYQFGKMPLN